MNASQTPGLFIYPIQRYPDAPVSAVEKADRLEKRQTPAPNLYTPSPEKSSAQFSETGLHVDMLA